MSPEDDPPANGSALYASTRSEILMSIGAALLLVAVTALRFLQIANTLEEIGCALVVVWVAVTLYRLRGRIWRREAARPDAAAATGADYYRKELERRRDHLRDAWLWDGPLFLACVILAGVWSGWRFGLGLGILISRPLAPGLAAGGAAGIVGGIRGAAATAAGEGIAARDRRDRARLNARLDPPKKCGGPRGSHRAASAAEPGRLLGRGALLLKDRGGRLKGQQAGFDEPGAVFLAASMSWLAGPRMPSAAAMRAGAAAMISGRAARRRYGPKARTSADQRSSMMSAP